MILKSAVAESWFVQLPTLRGCVAYRSYNADSMAKLHGKMNVPNGILASVREKNRKKIEKDVVRSLAR